MILPERAIEAVTPQRNNKTFALAILKQKNAHSLNFGQSFYVKGGEGRDNFVNLKNELRKKTTTAIFTECFTSQKIYLCEHHNTKRFNDFY